LLNARSITTNSVAISVKRQLSKGANRMIREEYRRLFVAAGVAVTIGATALRAQEFGYFGNIAPPFWASLDPAWTTCGSGVAQSPVDFGRITLLSRQARKLPVAYGPTTGEIFNNGHTIEVETEGANVLTLDGLDYELEQFHFHTPSEHRFEGRGFDMEMHLVHRSLAGVTAVVGIFVKRGLSSGPLSVVFQNLPAVDAPLNTRTPLPGFDLRAFLPATQANYRYAGSLTTPPCTEGVHWLVLEGALTVSDEDLAQFTRRIAFNARSVQRGTR
jgi:carbonic anhydrase